MKVFFGLVLTILPAYRASAATLDVKNVSSNKRVCTKVSDQGNVCKTSVSGKILRFVSVNTIIRDDLTFVILIHTGSIEMYLY
jgi:hypothetical protein